MLAAHNNKDNICKIMTDKKTSAHNIYTIKKEKKKKEAHSVLTQI